jgi:hypothetical protein
MQGVRQLDVVNIVGQTLDQSGIFGTFYASAYKFFRHKSSLDISS